MMKWCCPSTILHSNVNAPLDEAANQVEKAVLYGYVKKAPSGAELLDRAISTMLQQQRSTVCIAQVYCADQRFVQSFWFRATTLFVPKAYQVVGFDM